MGKGSKRRPCTVTKEESELRFKLAFEYLPYAEFYKVDKRIRELEAERVFSNSNDITD